MMQDTFSRPKPRLFSRWATALALALAAAVVPAVKSWAQPAGSPPAAPGAQAAATAPLSVTKPKATRPAWKELRPEQQLALQPLAPHWETLPADRKRKWLALSENYQAMPAAEQAKLHSRMRDWVLLSQQQRTQARLNYAETQKLTPEQKSAQWQAYQQLSAEEKRRLAAKAPPKPTGAAVVRPVAPEKRPQLTPTRAAKPDTSAATAPPPINRHTLLPQPPVADPAPPAAPPAAVPAEPPAPATAQ